MGQLAQLLPGNRMAWAHEFATQAEKSITLLCGTAQQYANTRIITFKAMDQGVFMAAYDRDPQTGQPYPASISSYSSWNAAVAEAAAAGVTLIPWVVPGHRSQAAAHAQLGPRIIVDAEPYRGFWMDPAGDFAGYIADLISFGCTEVYVSTDPRRSEEDALDESLWAPTVAGLIPQVYWTDFQQAYSAVLPMIDFLLGLNPVVIPALPYNGYADFPAAWAAMTAKGITGVSLWRMGSADIPALAAFATLQPVILDPCAGLGERVAALEEQLTAEQAHASELQSKLDEIAAVLSR